MLYDTTPPCSHSQVAAASGDLARFWGCGPGFYAPYRFCPIASSAGGSHPDMTAGREANLGNDTARTPRGEVGGTRTGARCAIGRLFSGATAPPGALCALQPRTGLVRPALPAGAAPAGHLLSTEK